MTKRGRKGAGKCYDHQQMFDSLEEAVAAMKTEFLGTKWKRLNTYNNVIWYECSKCDKRAKIISSRVDNGVGPVQLHVDATFFNDAHQHMHPDDNNEDGVQALSDEYVQKIFSMRANSEFFNYLFLPFKA
jgi:hypothetical protein